MNSVSKYIKINRYTILAKYKYFLQSEEDNENYVGGKVSINSHIIKKLNENLVGVIITDVNDDYYRKVISYDVYNTVVTHIKQVLLGKVTL